MALMPEKILNHRRILLTLDTQNVLEGHKTFVESYGHHEFFVEILKNKVFKKNL